MTDHDGWFLGICGGCIRPVILHDQRLPLVTCDCGTVCVASSYSETERTETAQLAQEVPVLSRADRRARRRRR